MLGCSLLAISGAQRAWGFMISAKNFLSFFVKTIAPRGGAGRIITDTKVLNCGEPPPESLEQNWGCQKNLEVSFCVSEHLVSHFVEQVHG